MKESMSMLTTLAHEMVTISNQVATLSFHINNLHTRTANLEKLANILPEEQQFSDASETPLVPSMLTTHNDDVNMLSNDNDIPNASDLRAHQIRLAEDVQGMASKLNTLFQYFSTATNTSTSKPHTASASNPSSSSK
jgi:hypothetical protein